jgi:two-component system CheB/CheR fusion protein
MGGRIWADSEPGLGSTFSFTAELGLAEAEQAAPDQAPAPEPAGRPGSLRVLLVEDNTINQFLVAELLKKRGHIVRLAGNGPAALEALQQESFDLVLLDIRLPGMEGDEVARLVRAGAAGDSRVPMVALTAHSFQGDRERFLAMGMDDYISKPIRIEALDRVLDQVARKRPAAPAVPT